jgi:hypothetical protein
VARGWRLVPVASTGLVTCEYQKECIRKRENV